MSTSHEHQPTTLTMLEVGESITVFTNRTGGTIGDYTEALLDHKRSLAQKIGVSDEELHQNIRLSKTVKDIAELSLEHLFEEAS